MRSGAKYVTHEGLSLNPGEGNLGRIVSSMLKDFSPVKDYLIHQFRTLGRKGSQMPVYKSVSPAYTSMCSRRGVKGTLDDRADSEWAICDTCKKINDRHRNAAINIGDRAVKKVYGKKKNKGEKTANPKEKS